MAEIHFTNSSLPLAPDWPGDAAIYALREHTAGLRYSIRSQLGVSIWQALRITHMGHLQPFAKRMAVTRIFIELGNLSKFVSLWPWSTAGTSQTSFWTQKTM
jgi:hypothetical protein